MNEKDREEVRNLHISGNRFCVFMSILIAFIIVFLYDGIFIHDRTNLIAFGTIPNITSARWECQEYDEVPNIEWLEENCVYHLENADISKKDVDYIFSYYGFYICLSCNQTVWSSKCLTDDEIKENSMKKICIKEVLVREVNPN